MKKLFSNPVFNHFLTQIGVGAVLSLATYLAGADYSALGAWATVASGAAAVGLSAVHKATGTA